MKVTLLGIRGIPASHGGFETFAEQLSCYFVDRGHKVTVYCQVDGKGQISESTWNGINLIHIPVSTEGPLGTIIFDLKSIWHARKSGSVHLTLGYNTAVFNIIQRLFGITNIINMDGIEWKRQKWGKIAKAWFWLNERLGCWFGNHLIADHPRIEDHLATRVSRKKITMIPYGGDYVESADVSLLNAYGLEACCYAVVIARPEPENSFLEIVQAFAASKSDHKLVVLGNFQPEKNDYHKAVIDAGNSKVIFPGTIYDKAVVAALRKFARFYIHGHQVGGTNPSLVEALAAGCAVIAHDNHFNRWVAGNAAFYFSDLSQLTDFFDSSFNDDALISKLQHEANQQFKKKFTWNHILQQYERLLISFSKRDK